MDEKELIRKIIESREFRDLIGETFKRDILRSVEDKMLKELDKLKFIQSGIPQMIRDEISRALGKRVSDIKEETIKAGVSAAYSRIGLLQKRVEQEISRKIDRKIKREIKVVEEQKKEAEKKAERDSLTGCFNRRFLERKINYMLRQKKGVVSPFSIVMVDLDDFKKINDTFGHQTGDSVLAEVAFIMRKCVKSSGYVVRYGGEEFIIILQGMRNISAFNIAESIRRDVENRLFHNDSEKNLKVTTSIGIASYPENARDKFSLIREADKALYRAKKTGKNKVCVADAYSDKAEGPDIGKLSYTG